MLKQNKPLNAQSVTTFGRRIGRGLTPEKRALVSNFLPEFCLEVPASGQLNAAEVRQDKRAIWLEIGFGGGEHLWQLSQNNPDVMMIGGEPFINGVASLLELIEKSYLQQQPDQVGGGEAVGSGAALAPVREAQNIRIVPNDIRPIMKALPDASLERIYVLFPDPWPKSRHHKRRIINRDVLDDAARLLPSGGILQLATDHADYSVWMLEQLLAHPAFAWQAECYKDWHEPPQGWVATRYETKTRAEGRQPVYLKFTRV